MHARLRISSRMLAGPLVTGLLIVPPACSSPIFAEMQAQQQQLAVENHATERLLAIEAAVMAADYRADLDRLAQLRAEVLPLTAEPALGYLAHYWAGFAEWRLAINGVNRGMVRDALKAHLERAAADFQASILLRDDFADSFAAAASVNGWLGSLNADDTATAQQYWAQMGRLLNRARELEPGNPRVLWVVGGDLLFRPVEFGGDPLAAIETYRQALAAADARTPEKSPLPDWGKPEALMALAFAHFRREPPDLEAAEQEARAALRLQPDWSYVREVLLPQIEAEQRKRGVP